MTSPGAQFDLHILKGSHINDLNYNYGILSAVCVIFFLFWGSSTLAPGSLYVIFTNYIQYALIKKHAFQRSPKLVYLELF